MLKSLKLKFSLMLAALCVVSYSVLAQDPTAVLDTPQDFVAPEGIGMLQTAFAAVVAYLSKFIPGVSKIKPTIVQAGIAIFVVVCGIATFKFGFFTKESWQYVFDNFMPNFAYSGVAYELVKLLLSQFGIQLKSKAAEAANPTQPTA